MVEDLAMAKDWIEIGCVDDIPSRGSRWVNLAGGHVSVAIFRTSDDEIFALIDRCPHRDGQLSEGIVSDRSVACPLHGWVIALDTGFAWAPDEGCTPTVPVKLIGRRIYIAPPDA